MKAFSFFDFTRLCELNTEKKYVNECLDYIRNQDCLYWRGVMMPYDHMLSLYQLRLSIAKDSDRGDLNYIADFEGIVSCMENVKSESVGIAELIGNEFSYLVFYEPNAFLIFGILRRGGYSRHVSGSNNSISEIAENEIYRDREAYSKGIQVHDPGRNR